MMKMNRKISFSIAFILMIGMLSLAAGKSAEVKSKEESSLSEETLVQGNTAFALDLYCMLKEREGNLFFSPHSISVALAMTFAGARGQTEKQMAETLHFSLGQEELHPAFHSIDTRLKEIQKKGAIQISVANALWPQKKHVLLEDYLALMKRYYGVSITPLDFKSASEKARETINSWVEGKTNEKIKDLIPRGLLDPLTRLVLTNAIYFKGDWTSQFDTKLTKKSPFHLLSGESKQVPMMQQKQDFGYAEYDAFQILDMPYAGDDLSMLILLPKQIEGIAELEEEIKLEHLEKWVKELHKEEVLVFLPKFKMTSQFNLAKILSLMGMPDAFSGNADFSGMDGTKELSISEVVHKAFIAVDEQGTEAAAATGVIMKLASMPPPAPVFKADHPFLFFIRDNTTKSILFMGRVFDPSL